MNNINSGKKPFPWHCSNCRKQAVYGAVVDCVRQMHHDGHEYTVKFDALKTPKCSNCGQVMLDAEALEVLETAFRRQLNLLSPEQIQTHRVKAGLSPEALAGALGVSEAAIARLENGGQLQSRSLDNLMRLFFGLAQVREILTTQKITTLAG